MPTLRPSVPWNSRRFRNALYGLCVALLIAAGLVYYAFFRFQFQFIPADKMPPEQTDTWDAKVENAIYIRYKPWNEVFLFHCFEDLLVPADGWPDRHFKNDRKLDETLFKWQKDGAGAMRFSLEQKELVPFKIEGRLWADGNKLRVEGTIENRSKYAWTPDQAGALMCFRAHLAKEFEDVEGMRIWLTKKSGGRVSVNDLVGRTVYPFFNFFVCRKDDPYEPWIAKENKTGTRRITFASTPAASLGGNRYDYMSCIHCNYALKAEPGATAHFASTITFEDIPGKRR
ncbi:hypothetical protein LLG95_08290 [bacterium]|nr:hypothetical protein [bacterium]